MTDEREFERTVDAAARAMMAREPSPSLGYAVMTRVREGRAPAPRRLWWMAVTASLVLCGAIVMVMTLNNNRAPQMAALPAAAQLRVGQLPVEPRAPVTEVMSAANSATPVRRRIGMATRVTLPPDDVSSIEPIQQEPIVLSAIDVPRIERDTTAIDSLSVEPLTIEPLAASND